MKKITIIAVGRLKESFFVAAAEEYLKRLGRFCEVKIIELADAEGRLTDAEVKRKEGDFVLAALKNQGFWLLDIQGEQPDSCEFAAMLDKSASSAGGAVFVIGGSCGVDERIRAAADRRVSFGRLTYPHRLMRIMLLEQIYRAMTISGGTPYHK